MKRLPIDVSSFPIMIGHDYLYVDKTQHIYDLVTKGRFYFLSRPRRFGKSLLVSTLNELFSGNKKLFEQLLIGKSDYDWQVYPVINLNFSKLSYATAHEFKHSLLGELGIIAQSYDIEIPEGQLLEAKIDYLVRALYKKNSVVILIDEYDLPLLRKLHDINEAKKIHEVIRDFFTVIKALDQYLRAVFITGVTKFAKTSIFSGMNNLNDISITKQAAALLGYTDHEIDYYFHEYIAYLAQLRKTTHDDIRQKIRLWYNGYRFSEEDIYVYNPFSVLYCFERERFANYWFETGTPGFLINLIQDQYRFIKDIDRIDLGLESLGAFDIEHLPIIPILFQTGYLTIDSYHEETRRYTLSFPNEEVRESFKKYLIAALVNTTVSTVDITASQLMHALNNNDIPTFCMILQSLFANIPYYLHREYEYFYHALFQFLGSMLGMDIQPEVATDKGRIDVVLSTKTHIFIFEVKFKASAQTALKQIETRKYYEKYRLQHKKIILVGLSFKYLHKKLTIDCAYRQFM